MDPKQTTPVGTPQNDGGQQNQTPGVVSNAPVAGAPIASTSSATLGASPSPAAPAGIFSTPSDASAAPTEASTAPTQTLSTGANLSRTMDNLNRSGQGAFTGASATGQSVFAKKSFDTVEPNGDIILPSSEPQARQKAPRQPMDSAKLGRTAKIAGVVLAVALVVLGGVLVGRKLLVPKTTETPKIARSANLDTIFDTTAPIPVEQDGKYGYVDGGGNWTINPQYLYAERFYGNYAIVFLPDGDGKAIINRNGEVVASGYYSEYIIEQDLWTDGYNIYDGNFVQVNPENSHAKYLGNGYIQITPLPEVLEYGNTNDETGEVTETVYSEPEEEYIINSFGDVVVTVSLEDLAEQEIAGYNISNCEGGVYGIDGVLDCQYGGIEQLPTNVANKFKRDSGAEPILLVNEDVELYDLNKKETIRKWSGLSVETFENSSFVTIGDAFGNLKVCNIFSDDSCVEIDDGDRYRVESFGNYFRVYTDEKVRTFNAGMTEV